MPPLVASFDDEYQTSGLFLKAAPKSENIVASAAKFPLLICAPAP